MQHNQGFIKTTRHILEHSLLEPRMGIITEYDKEIKLKRNAQVGCPSANVQCSIKLMKFIQISNATNLYILRDQCFIIWTKSQTSRVYFDVL